MKWVVFWTLAQLLPAACPPFPPDVYGRESMMQTSQACWYLNSESKSKEFDVFLEAQEFMEKGKRECSDCKDWVILEKWE